LLDAAGTIAEQQGDFWVVKLDGYGNKRWDRSFGGLGGDFLESIGQTGDGGFVFGGTAFNGYIWSIDESFNLLVGSEDFLVVRTDDTGRTLWQQYLGGSDRESFTGLSVVNNNGVMIAGNSVSPPSNSKTDSLFGGYDVWTAFLDSAGNKVWDRSFGGTSTDQINLARRTADGGMILCGVTSSDISGNKTSPTYGWNDVWLVRLNANGDKLWDQTLGGSFIDTAVEIFEMPEGGFMVGCGSWSPVSGNRTNPPLDPSPINGGDFWIVRVDAAGRILWDYSFGTGYADLVLGFQPAPDAGAIMSGVSLLDPFANTSSPQEFRLIRIDSEGRELWTKAFDTAITSINWFSRRFLLCRTAGSCSEQRHLPAGQIT
jgi:hypothetical protein